MVLAWCGSFRTGPLSRHTTTNIDVIAHLMDVAIDLVEKPKRVTRKLHDAVARP
jgi:RNA 3'-terminal phosphate cyclase